VSEIALAGLLSVMAALLVLGAAAALGWSRVAVAGSLLLCAGGAAMALAVLFEGAVPAALALPLGPPGAAMILAIDGLSAFFLLLLLLGGGAVCVAALDDNGGGAAASLPLLLGSMMLALLAADGFALVLGLGLAGLVTFAKAAAARFEPGMAVLALVCLVAAVALLGDGGWGFAAMRGHAMDGGRGAAVFLLVLVGAGSRAVLTPVDTVLSGLGTKVVVYVLMRVLFDLAGPAQPSWWGIALMLLGAAGAVLGALRANMADDLRSILGWATVANSGLIGVGLGAGLVARAADLVPLVALGLGAAMLLALAQAMFMSMLLLGTGAIEVGAGSRRLDRLGGLVRSMPITTGCMLAGAAALAALPPTAGFAGLWMLLQAVFATSRAGGLGVQLLSAGIVAAAGLATALSAAAMVRMIGVAMLGRPRSPRASAASEAGAGARLAMLGLAVVSVLMGLFPGAVLGLAGPALRLLSGASMAGRAGAFSLAAQADAPGYLAPAIAVLLGLAVAAALRGARGGEHGVAAWECGAEPAPPWLPFGDPLTQYGGASMAQPLRKVLGAGGFEVARLRPEVRGFAFNPTVRQAVAAIAVIAVLALSLVVMAGQW